MSLANHLKEHAILGTGVYNPAAVAITGGTINGITELGLGEASDVKVTRYAAKQLMISGDGVGAGGDAGLIFGNVASGVGAVGASTVALASNNAALKASATTTTVNVASGGSIFFAVNGNNVASLVGGLWSLEKLSITDTADSSSTTTGSLKTAGGLGVAKKSFFGDSLNVAAPGTLSVGTGNGTSAGLIVGYSGTSGYGAIWSTGVTPLTTNYALASNGSSSFLNGTISSILGAGGSNRLTVSTTSITHVGDMIYDKTITAPGTTGAQTINKTTGRVNFAAAATSLVVTNSLVTANSIITCNIATADATAADVKAVAAAGSFTIYLGAAPTAETAVDFRVTN